MTNTRLVKVEEVYCNEHGCVHDNTINPYGEGPESWCDPREHRLLYYRTRKGDVEND